MALVEYFRNAILRGAQLICSILAKSCCWLHVAFEGANEFLMLPCIRLGGEKKKLSWDQWKPLPITLSEWVGKLDVWNGCWVSPEWVFCSFKLYGICQVLGFASNCEFSSNSLSSRRSFKFEALLEICQLKPMYLCGCGAPFGNPGPQALQHCRTASIPFFSPLCHTLWRAEVHH